MPPPKIRKKILSKSQNFEAILTSFFSFQTSPKTGEAELYYLRLPKDIKNFRVILMDATVATGASAMMAIRVLLDHDVPEENINLVKTNSILNCEKKKFPIE